MPHVVVLAPTATYTRQWCDVFRDAGWRVDWISYAFEAPEAAATIPEVSRRFLPQTLVALVRETFRLRRLLRDLRPDLLHVHWITGPTWLATLSGFRPFVATAWGSDALLHSRGSVVARLLAPWSGRAAAAVTHDADVLADALVRLGMPRSRMRRIVFGADPELFRPLPADPALLRSLGIEDDDPVLISSRGTRDVYCPETVLRGFALALERRPCNLLVRTDDIHNPEDATGSAQSAQWKRLSELARELGVERRVFPYVGVPRADLPRLLASCAAFLSVPRSDGTSVALLEALFSETPAIVSDLPANREWIRDESYGHLVPVRDAGALADAIVEVLEDPEDARARARKAAALAREHGNAETEFARARELYDEVLRAGPRRGRRARSQPASSR